MKFTLNRPAAAAAVKTCMSVVTGKTTLPILSCLLVEAKDNQVRFVATDLDRWMEFRMPADVKKPGSAALSAKLLSNIFAKTAGDEVEIDLNGKLKASVKSGDASFSFPGLPAAEFPEVEGMNDGALVEMPTEEWASMSGAVSWAASRDELRYTLMGTYLTQEAGKFALVATNGASLSMAWLQDADDDGETPRDVIIPSETMRAISAITEHAETIQLRIGGSKISASCGDVTVTSKLIEGEYPQFRRVIPQRDRSKMTIVRIPAREFMETLGRASLVLEDKLPSIVLTVTDGKMEITGDNRQSESSSATSIPVVVEGPPAKIVVNPQRLQEPFRTWDQQEIEMEIDDEMSPLLLRAPGRQFVLMPMRITA